MGIYNKALVPYDGSESSKNALRQACAMDDVLDLYVISVLPTYEGDLELIGVDNIKKIIEGPVQELIDEAKNIAKAAGRDIKTEARYGEPFQEIIDYAQDIGAHVIIMGRKGLSMMERQLIGSVTAKVVVHSDRDVMVLPQGAKIKWSKLLVAVDQSEFAKRAFLRGVELAKIHGSSLEVVHVIFTFGKFCGVPPEAVKEIRARANAYMEQLQKMAKDRGVDVSTNVLEGEVHEGIADAAQEKEVDIIIMGSRGMSGIKRLMLGSVTEKVIGMVDCPVLAIH